MGRRRAIAAQRKPLRGRSIAGARGWGIPDQ